MGIRSSSNIRLVKRSVSGTMPVAVAAISSDIQQQLREIFGTFRSLTPGRVDKLHRLIFLGSDDSPLKRELDQHIPLKGNLVDIPDSIHSLINSPLDRRFYDSAKDFREICRQLNFSFKDVNFTQQGQKFNLDMSLANGKVLLLSYNPTQGSGLPDAIILGIQKSKTDPQWLSWLRLCPALNQNQAMAPALYVDSQKFAMPEDRKLIRILYLLALQKDHKMFETLLRELVQPN